MSGTAADVKRLMMAPPPLTLAAAESLTCGHVQALIGSVSGASNYFHGGITAYTLDQKVRHLGVDRAAARKVNAVSADVAAQMARGVCALFDTDLGVATTGYAERSPSDHVAVPFAWWGLAHRTRRGRVTVLTGRVECFGAKRVEVQEMVADAVVTELVAYLEKLRG